MVSTFSMSLIDVFNNCSLVASVRSVATSDFLILNINYVHFS